MKRYNLLYYLLIVLLIMGAFASMAQNSYGQTILGLVSIAFGFTFLWQLIYVLRKFKKTGTATVIELSALTIISFLLLFRLFHIYFPFVEWIFATAGVSLAAVYIQKMITRFQLLRSKSPLLAILLLLFHLCIILFIAAMIAFTFLPGLAKFAGGVAFVLLLVILASMLFNREILLDGEKVSPLGAIARFKDRSLLLASLFFIFSLYMLLTSSGVLPRLYSDEFPQAYYELVNKAETGKETLVNGKYKHEEFKELYDRFLNRNVRKNANAK